MRLLLRASRARFKEPLWTTIGICRRRQHSFQIPHKSSTVLLGCVSYDPAVGSIWEQMKRYLRATGVPTFDFVLFSNYEQQVRALLDGHIDIAWNGPLAHVLCEANAEILSLGMRDVDCDFESIVVVRKNHNNNNTADATLHHAQLLSGARDSPQAHVVPRYHLQDVLRIPCTVTPLDEDVGKHGDTAVGEIRAMEMLLAQEEDSKNQYQGAILSRMMWDRAVTGQVDTVDADKLRGNFQVYTGIDFPRFDHCQFDALLSNKEKVEPFYNALHAMDYNDPSQQTVMKLEGIRNSWSKPRQSGYDIVRSAMGVSANHKRAQNFAPSGARSYSTRAAAAPITQSVRSLSSTDNNNNSHIHLAPGSRVGVIGCGVAGLQVIRSMRARGYDVTAFDRADDVGGLWRQNYRGYALQVGKQFYEMPDLEMTEAEWQELASGEKVHAYLRRFASEFDLNRSVVLNTGINGVKKHADGSWTFLTDAGKEHTFDYCVVCTGMYSSVPFMPDVAGRDAFSGSVIHSSQFLDAQETKGKRVVVVGGGKSATDCSVAAAQVGAESVTMIQRNAHWPTPLYIAGIIPFQHVFLSRLGQALVEAKVGVYPGSKSFASMFRPLMGTIFAIVEELFAFQLGLKGDLRPKSGVVEDFYGYAQVQDTKDGSFKSLRDAGRINVMLGTIEAFTDKGVRVNGQEIAADKVIFATGFAKDYGRLFEAHIMKRLNVQKDGLYLYKRILPPSVNGLAFVGSECATIFNCTNSGLQAEWLARTLAGETKQNLNEEMMAAEAQAFEDFARSWMPETSSRSGLVLLHQLHYYDQLLLDMGENPSRKSNPVSEYLGSYYSRDYNNIVSRTIAEPIVP